MNCYSHDKSTVVSYSITGSKKERMGRNIKGKEPPPPFSLDFTQWNHCFKINWYASLKKNFAVNESTPPPPRKNTHKEQSAFLYLIKITVKWHCSGGTPHNVVHYYMNVAFHYKPLSNQ